MKFVCISDTHSYHRRINVPDGDVLIHAGDISWRGERDILEDFNEWLGELPHPYKIIIAGNHDKTLERDPDSYVPIFTNGIYLKDEEIVIEGIKIWGSPWTLPFFDWAFMCERGAKMKKKWDMIPNDTDILVTHGPPYKQLDLVYFDQEHVGCADLMDAVIRVKPRYHIFGHIHETYGMSKWLHEDGSETTFLNASNCTLHYKPTNKPVVFDLTKNGS